MPLRPPPLVRFAAAATLVAIADLATKALALALLGAGQDVPLAGPLHLTLVHNTASAGSVSLGAYTWHINALATLLSVVLAVLVCSRLAALDRAAPVMLGLIAGAALGNLGSMVVPPAGVPDFIAYRYEFGTDVVFNVADVAAYIGIALAARTATLIGFAILRERRAPRPALPARAPRPETVVPIALAIEPSRLPSPTAPRRSPAPHPEPRRAEP
ncbi:MAG TPA: signal peptidase II [Gemmatimonadaceae bacterium]|nr:signal peptidase II [Gemmatimonadaceae bacterium]